MSLAFVLSGGGSLGSIQVGMLRALYERGIAPDLIVGTSAGAINGAFIASRPQTVETVDTLAGIWRSVRRSQVFPLNPLTGLFGFIGARRHLVPDSGLRRLLERHLDYERLEDAPIPLHVIATDVMTGAEVRLSSGPAIDAIMASAAIPGVLPPVRWDGMELIDGGVASNTPIGHALELDADEVYVLSTGSACALSKPPSGALGMLIHATSLMIQRQLEADIRSLGEEASVIILPPPCPYNVQPTDFGHADSLIEQALRRSREFLDGIPGVPEAALAEQNEKRVRKREIEALPPAA